MPRVHESHHASGEKHDEMPGRQGGNSGQYCQRCLAWKGCLGLEPEPSMFVEHLVEIFREVKRVLRNDGCAFINLGDSYAGSGHGYLTEFKGKQATNRGTEWMVGQPPAEVPKGMRALDLCNIPHRVAEALRADGWYWRSTVIFSKVNPMPESIQGWRWERCRVKVASSKRATSGYNSVQHAEATGRPQGRSGRTGTDGSAQWQDCPGCPRCEATGGYLLRKGSWRPTTAHEYVFMFTKSDSYFCDGEAVKEASIDPESYTGRRARSARRISKVDPEHDKFAGSIQENGKLRSGQIYPVRNLRSVWSIPSSPSTWEYCSGCGTLFEDKERSKIIKVKDGGGEETVRFCPVCYRWDAFESHFAAFPAALPERCLKASTSEAGCCPKCGAAWAQVVERPKAPPDVFTARNAPTDGYVHSGSAVYGEMVGHGQKLQNWRDEHPLKTLGFRPTCTCPGLDGDSPGSMCGDDDNFPSVPMRVLDPFVGSGTTGIVAKRLGLDFVGVDVKPVYCAISEKRIEKAPGPDKQMRIF